MSVIRLLNSSSRRALFPGASVALDFTKGQYRLPTGASWSITRASTGYAETESGLLVPFGVNEMRRTDKGLLVEESRTNLLLQSGTLSNAAWKVFAGATKVGSAPITDPAGGNSAYEVSFGATGGTSAAAAAFYQDGFTISASTAYTISAWVRAKTGSTTVRLTITSNGSTTDGSSEVTVTETWQRLTFTATTNATISAPNVGIRNNTAGNSANVYVAFFQLEAGSFATSYIPTTSASATRAADVTHLALGSTAAEGTVVASIIWPAALASGNPRIIGQHGTSSTPISLDTSGAQVISFNGTAALNHLVSATTSGTVFTAAMRWSAAGRGISAKGATPSTDANLIGTFNDMALGYQGIGTTPLNGYLRRVLIYPRAFTDAELQAATT